jgi:uncharacterized membrane protein YbjE (DUF340 family)
VLLAVLAQLLDPDKGPEPTGDWRSDPEAFLALVIIGFAIGILGHIFKSKTMVATGILMVFLATVGIPLYLQLTR